MGRRGRTDFKDENYFFVTTTIVNHARAFICEPCCTALINNIKYYQAKYKFSILAYIIMPPHFHWILEINPEKGTISDIMRDIKKHSAWDIMEILEKLNDNELIKLISQSAESYKDQKRKLWEKRFDDEVIRNQKMFFNKLYYIHNNPIKAGLVNLPEEYKYSSAKNYVNDDYSILFVDTEKGGFDVSRNGP